MGAIAPDGQTLAAEPMALFLEQVGHWGPRGHGKVGWPSAAGRSGRRIGISSFAGMRGFFEISITFVRGPD